MNYARLTSMTAVIGGGFFVSILIGYALKKVIKISAVIAGLFLTGLAYLQYQQIVSIDWNKLQVVAQNAFGPITNATRYLPGIDSGLDDNAAATLSISNLGIPLTESMAMGFAIGFVKG